MATLGANQVNASTKILKKWKQDIKEDGTLEWWQIIAGVWNSTIQMQTINTNQEKESSYQNIPVLLWNKTLTFARIVT